MKHNLTRQRIIILLPKVTTTQPSSSSDTARRSFESVIEHNPKAVLNVAIVTNNSLLNKR